MGPSLLWVFAASSLMLLSPSEAKPVRRGPPQPHTVEGGSPDNIEDTNLEYDHYLRQVVQVLETDRGFKEKLEKANISDIKSGKIASDLEFVQHSVRTALDELKRREIDRLRELARIQLQANGPQGLKNIPIPGHLDLKNPHSFEVEDLKNLIIKTTSDLEELDKKRREEFKEYEMEKEYERQEHLKQMSEEERKKEEARLEELKKKHANHPKVNHPGSKDQFEEVWDKVDHLEDQQFNPKTFFFKHDINGDMEWSVDEVDAVLQLELDKVYDARNSPDEDDPVERQEEMNRMREHVFQEMDKDKNWRISLKEFLDYTGAQGEQAEFNKDDGWKTVDEEPVFTDEDYQKFMESYHAQPGVVQPPHDQDLKFQSEQHGQQQQPPQGQNFQQQQFHQGQQQFHQGQQQFHQQPPQGQPQYQQPSQYQQPPQGGQQQFQQQPPQGGQQQFQQQPPQGGQQQFQQPSQGGQQQFQQPHQGGQQQFQQPPQGGQFQQPPQGGQQQFQQQPPQGGQQQFQQQPPQGGQQFQQPPQGGQQQFQQQPPQGGQFQQPPQGGQQQFQQQPPQGGQPNQQQQYQQGQQQQHP